MEFWGHGRNRERKNLFLFFSLLPLFSPSFVPKPPLSSGGEGDELYIIEDDQVQVSIDDVVVLKLMSGEMAG